MGGFQIDVSDHASQRPVIRGLRPHILLDLAKDGQFDKLNVAAADLVDKSKFDVFGSLVAGVQALWFCVQCIARVREGIAISLLEVWTVAHVSMSFFTLILWWQKPQFVNRGHVILHHSRLLEIEKLIGYEKAMSQSGPSVSKTRSEKDAYVYTEMVKANTDRVRRKRAMRRALSELDFLTSQGESLWMFHISQSRKMRERWFDEKVHFWATSAFWAPVAVYGSIHLAAWNAHFPTTAERILWLVAAAVITVVGTLYASGIWLVYWFGSSKLKETIPSPNGPPIRYAHLLGSLTIGAHVYLSIESWLALRSLPVSAFQTVEWATVFPHFS